MRLGLIGPAKRNPKVLRERAEFVLDELRADRAVYLGVDGALDDVVKQWAHELVKGDPSDSAVWQRAAQSCAGASAEQISAFLAAERRRQQLKQLECLPHANARTIELFESVVAVLIHDKALLDEEDMLPASILVFGRSAEPVIHKIGLRCFLSPGPVTHPNGGVALLAEEEDGNVRASLYGIDGSVVKSEVVAQPNRAARMTVQGGAAS
jgi:hypothetical protein